MTKWVFIDGYGGLYRVSDSGVVQSCHKKGSRGGCRGGWWDMSISLDRNGYRLVYLWKHGRIRCLVHQIVAASFIGARPKGMDAINHMDGNKLNNTPTNLEYTTLSENTRHAWRTGLCKPHKLTAESVADIRSCGGTDTATAKAFGVSQVMVSKIRRGVAWCGTGVHQ